MLDGEEDRRCSLTFTVVLLTVFVRAADDRLLGALATEAPVEEELSANGRGARHTAEHCFVEENALL